MPLYGGLRDVGFIKGIAMELFHQVLSTEVVLYKISQVDTSTNIYGEAIDRRYRPGVRVFAMVEADDTATVSDSDVMDFTKSILFTFIKVDLKNQNLYLEEGDIIMYDEKYFEVDSVNDEKYWTNRNPNTNIGMNRSNWPLHGYDYTIIAQCHMTNREILNIEDDVRTGDNNTINKVPPSFPKYL